MVNSHTSHGAQTLIHMSINKATCKLQGSSSIGPNAFSSLVSRKVLVEYTYVSSQRHNRPHSTGPSYFCMLAGLISHDTTPYCRYSRIDIRLSEQGGSIPMMKKRTRRSTHLSADSLVKEVFFLCETPVIPSPHGCVAIRHDILLIPARVGYWWEFAYLLKTLLTTSVLTSRDDSLLLEFTGSEGSEIVGLWKKERCLSVHGCYRPIKNTYKILMLHVQA